MEDDLILQLLKKQQKHGNRQRLRAVSVFHAKHPEYSARRFQELTSELRNRLLPGERKTILSVEHCAAHLIWSMKIFEQAYRGMRAHVLQVSDLAENQAFGGMDAGNISKGKRRRKDAERIPGRISIQHDLESREYIRLFRDGRDLH